MGKRQSDDCGYLMLVAVSRMESEEALNLSGSPICHLCFKGSQGQSLKVLQSNQ